MSDTLSLLDPATATALARVHGRLRRRRNRIRSAGAAATVCVALGLGIGVAVQGSTPELRTPPGPDAIGPMTPSTGPTPSAPAGSCGAVPATAVGLGLEITIQGRSEWGAGSAQLLTGRQVRVTIRNLSRDPVTVWSPSAVGVTDGTFVITDPSRASTMPTTRTLDPSEAIELPASLPDRSCLGAPLGPGRYEFVPILAVADTSGTRLVSGDVFEAVYR